MAHLSASDKAALDRWVEAKRSRDFNTADRIRLELESRGIKAEQAATAERQGPSLASVIS